MRSFVSFLLALALVLSTMIIFVATPVLTPATISQPGGTAIEVVQGDEFTLGFRLRWDEDAKGYFAISISWDSPRVDNGGTPGENFTFVEARPSTTARARRPLTRSALWGRVVAIKGR